MEFTLEEYRHLGADKDKIQDFYQTEEPEIILAVLLDPSQAGLEEEGQRILRDLLEDSIILEQHIAFRGFDDLDGNLDPSVFPVYRNIAYQGFLYDETGRKSPGIGEGAMRHLKNEEEGA